MSQRVIANDEDGSLQIINSKGKVKYRKGQSIESFDRELRQFYSNGPILQEFGWLIKNYETEKQEYDKLRNLNDDEEIKQKLNLFDLRKKSNRSELINVLENQFYFKKYEKCLEICLVMEELIKLWDLKVVEFKEIEEIKLNCMRKVEKKTN